jgi:hypothetical protein
MKTSASAALNWRRVNQGVVLSTFQDLPYFPSPKLAFQSIFCLHSRRYDILKGKEREVVRD